MIPRWVSLLLLPAMLRGRPPVGDGMSRLRQKSIPRQRRVRAGAALSETREADGCCREARPKPLRSPQRRGGLRWRASGAVAGLALGWFGLAGAALAADSFLTPLGPVAEAQRVRLIRVVLITMIAIVPVLIGVPLILWRYRRGRAGDSTYRPGWSFSWPLEIAMWGVPFAIICTAAFWLWHETTTFDPYRPLGRDPLVVQVVGLDWKWLFIYPHEGIASVGELALPVGRPVELILTADTVMQSFWVPAVAGQIYAMPGMQTTLNLLADRPGTTMGKNAPYNGDGFAGQTFTVQALAAT